MSNTTDFETQRLNQLAEQYLSGSTANGQVIFFSENSENRLDYATWQFNDDDHQMLKHRGFKLMLMELLDTLMIDRARQGAANASQGVIHVDGEKLTIRWVPKAVAEDLRSNGL